MDEAVIPGFRALFEECFEQIHALSLEFSSLVAEALGLPSDALDKFYEKVPNMRVFVTSYPHVEVDTEEDKDDQDRAAHYDAGFLTFVSITLRFYLIFLKANSISVW